MPKIFIGKVVSVKTPKMVTVAVEVLKRHPLYKKTIKKTKKYKVESGSFELALGEKVKIKETRPISKDKHFKVNEIIKRSVQ